MYQRNLLQFAKDIIFALLILLVFFGANTLSAQPEEAGLHDAPDTLFESAGMYPRGIVGYSDREVLDRMSQLHSSVPIEINSTVRSYLNTYMFRKKEKTEVMLGKRLSYFPIFEQKLKEIGAPNDLKYLAVVESALNPVAVSRVGATGLWQFMPETGSEYGLRQNSQVDERSDVIKSTEAAARYLKRLHTQFDDWALALAAYNSGPTRVNNAIKKAHSRNFWKLQRFLPAETANYVPAFIAATYICNFWQMHNFSPDDPDLDYQLTSYIRIWESISFRSIADATGVDYRVIKELNPGYKKDYIPANMEGHYVVLPTRVMTAFTKHMNSLSSQRSYVAELASAYVTSEESSDGRYTETLFKIENTDHVDRIGLSVGANGEQIKSWNRLQSNFVPSGTYIKVFRPVVIQKHTKLNIEPPASAIVAAAPPPSRPSQPERTDPPPVANVPAPPTTQENPPSKTPETRKENQPPAKQYQWHTVQRNESISDIARKYRISEEAILSKNNIYSIKVGMRIKIKEL